MYNRYIPQPDGSYRRSRMQDRCSAPPPRKPPAPEPKQEKDCPQDCPEPIPAPPQHKRQEKHTEPPAGGSITGFLRQLLPKDLDTSDLLIIILLLLMAGDSADDQNSALLTLALYLFM